MTYEIAGELFGNTEEVKKRVTAIRGRSRDGERIGEQDSAFLMEFFSYHDEWELKTGEEWYGFTTKKDPYGNRGFGLIKEFGEVEMISFYHTLKCMSVADKLPRALLNYRGAARNTVRADILQFRIDRGCLKGDEYHVDHTPPLTFDRLAFEFCQRELVNPLLVAVRGREGVLDFVDENLACAWRGYHKQHARLRLITKKENLSLAKENVDWQSVMML